jgi:subtilase family serine protease
LLPFIAFSLQAAYAAAFGPADLHNPNVLVPNSSIPKWFETGQAAHTHVLMWVGAPQHTSEFWEPIAQSEPNTLYSGPAPRAFTPSGFGPSDIRNAYGVSALGGAKAIAIVDAYHYPTALSDFNSFCSQFGLPRETSSNPTASTNQVLQVVSQGSGTPAVNADWNIEAALDIQWAHAMAPNAKIYLVEANTSNLSDMFLAVKKAAGLPNVKEVSMSWGAGEFSSETSADSTFASNGVVFFASTGDSQAVREYPSESPNVVAVGGTTLHMSHGAVTSEGPWMGSGGGISAYEARPSYQNNLASVVGKKRGAADISAVADPNTGVAIYCKGWMVVGGTSLSCPVMAGLVNRASSFLSSSNAELTKIYGGAGGKNFRKVVGAVSSSSLWNYATGVGSPLGTIGL